MLTEAYFYFPLRLVMKFVSPPILSSLSFGSRINNDVLVQNYDLNNPEVHNASTSLINRAEYLVYVVFVVLFYLICSAYSWNRPNWTFHFKGIILARKSYIFILHLQPQWNDSLHRLFRLTLSEYLSTFVSSKRDTTSFLF